MAFTFGAATGDDVNHGGPATSGAGSHCLYHAMWVYPTTLTAGRVLWGNGATWRIEIAPTTSELRIVSDNTTDGVRETSGLSLTVNQWRFLAFLTNTNNTGPVLDTRVWAGTPEIGPTLISTTQITAPVGNFTGANAHTWGNQSSTATVAFQGDIGEVWWGYTQQTAGTQNPFDVMAYGTITAELEENVFRRWVMPRWRGDPYDSIDMTSRRVLYYTKFDQAGPITQVKNPAIVQAGWLATTVNGATLNLGNRCPRPPLADMRYPRRRTI